MSENEKANPVASRVHSVEDENLRIANETMPGNRAELPKGVLRDGPVRNQADQNRDQPLGPDGQPTKPLP